MTTQVPIGDGVRGVGLSTHETVDALEPPRLHDRLLGRYRTVPSERRHLYNGAILYTTSDEDSTSELWALRLGPGDAVLSITGSGCRTLALLAGDVRRVVSVDGNPLQNYLLELKMHAMQAMEREEFLEFVGVRATNDRLTRYATFRRSVSDQALRFWDSNPHIIARGVIFSGAHETYYRRILSPLILGVRREKVRRLFSFEDVSEQREFYQRDWNTRWWRLALRLALRPSVFRLGVRDPSYFENIELPESVANYCFRRIEHSLTHVLARDNHLVALLFLGHYHNESALPVYLLEDYYDTIRSRLDRIEVVTASIDRYLDSCPDREFDKFSLSDISGWTSPSTFAGVLRAVARTGRPGGRVVYRNFLTKRSIPESLTTRLRPRPDLSAELDDRDLAFAYTFVVADIEAPFAAGETR